MIPGSNILLGVTGGIAAFKAAELVRRLKERGHDVRCVMTRSAEAFITPLTLEVLSGHPVYREEYLQPDNSGEELHISAAEWADLLCVAPVTAHTLARLALGLADDFLTTTALAFSGPLVLAPAMHTGMWQKESVQGHLEVLKGRSAHVVGPVVGALASGETGMGRMADLESIVLEVELALGDRDLVGKTVLVSAGPTQEPLDPVRYLSNRSSGRMGFALAEAAARRGARVVLVAGPVDLETPPGVSRADVVTAREMRDTINELALDADVIIMAAAVSDFRPSEVSDKKLKKRAGMPQLSLESNPDILAGLEDLAPHALRIGFAAETGDTLEEARGKLEAKNLHFIIANDVSRSDIGFDSEHNEVTVLGPARAPVFFSRQSKRALAVKLMDLFSEALKKREGAPAPTRG
ncbi:MAG: bifunctional phosphopantothenoylcysteine decarboxylase/phosphopantothenate--cysteine ligase CoaBC [Acidobacteria bacterium]|nr:MAG: bifunctional phosphopantothenoylcysteine decarboxylase/phosphopantothenate--cysteine ligase CoaBC [Acidobacteriota bacterium]